MQVRVSKCIWRGLDSATGQTRFFCEVCSYVTQSARSGRSDAIRHEKRHTGERPFGCDICQQRFVRKEHLKRHVNRHMLAMEAAEHEGEGPGPRSSCFPGVPKREDASVESVSYESHENLDPLATSASE